MPTRRAIFVLALALTCASSTDVLGSSLWDDRPLQVVQTSQATFPHSLAAEGVGEGEVRVVLCVDADGTLLDYLVTAYTRREFADELVPHVRDWRYEPARQRGEPVGSRVELAFTFQARGMVLSLSPQDAVAVATNRLVRPTLTSLVFGQSQLDVPVRAVHVVHPQHPGNQVASPPARPTVVIDFYIDMEGKPRMPVMLRGSHELYAIAAIDALMQWRFSPPTRHSRPVIARATQQFNFSERAATP